MHIAILGATSQIAKDLICSFAGHSNDRLTLFTRRVETVHDWLAKTRLTARHEVKSYDGFNGKQKFDAIINFVGVGDPAKAAVMGTSILDITYQYDTMVLEYLKKYPDCRYIFLSSGAAYGFSFSEPVDEQTQVKFPINYLGTQDWYGIAKFYAECRHRSLSEMPIVDLRIFNYFSHTQDMDARFLITDIVRAIRDKTVLITTAEHIMRDYLHPSDFYQIVSKILKANPINTSVDCFTLEPIEKRALLVEIQKNFGLEYQINYPKTEFNNTSSKPFYYSINRRAEQFNYYPMLSSLQGILNEVGEYLVKKK